jgi:hypothetical protein
MTFKLALVLGPVMLAAAMPGAGEQGARIPPAEQVLATLVKSHPRLVLTPQRLAELKKLAETDKLLAKGVADVIAEADALARRPALVHKLIGPRLLHVSRDCVRRMYAFGLAWRWTHQRKYVDKARENLLAVCDFADWNPRHFLDTAEMSHAVAIGYDWFHDELDEPARERIRKGLIAHGMEPGLKCYGARPAGWTRSAFNWNQVCNMGLIIGSLGIAETHPQYARQILPQALASLPRAMATYAPDGAWPEGPGYWGYATRYTVYGLAAMQTALGTDFGLSKIPGLDQAGYFPVCTTGPTGYYFNFADTGGRSRRGNLPSLFWLARRYGGVFLAAAERDMLAGRRATALDVIWYVPPGGAAAPKPQLARLFGGKVEVAVFRSAWGDGDALFAAIKGGYNQVNHGHLDLGSFELDALGVRWARELGSDNYNLPSYWGSRNDAQRWKYYRLGSLSHSVPLLDERNQDAYAVAKVKQFKADGRNGLVVIDLGAAYKHAAAKAARGLRMVQGRAVLVQDELEITQPCQAAWGMTTDARIAAGGAEATLTLDGRTLTARVLAPDGASFAVESAEQKPPQATNEGVRRLMVRVQAPKGPLRFAILLSPHWPDGKQVRSCKLAALRDWE